MARTARGKCYRVSKRHNRHETGRSSKSPALTRFDHPIQTAPQGLLHTQYLAAPSAYDLTARRLPLPIPGTSIGTGTSTGTSAGFGTSTGTVTGTSGAQFSCDDNLRAITAQAKQNPDTRAGYRWLFGVLQSFCAAHDHDAQVFSLELAKLDD